MSFGIWTRRGFARSLSRTALILSLDDVLKLGAVGQTPQAAPKPVTSQPAYNAVPHAAPQLVSAVAGEGGRILKKMPMGFPPVQEKA